MTERARAGGDQCQRNRDQQAYAKAPDQWYPCLGKQAHAKKHNRPERSGERGAHPRVSANRDKHRADGDNGRSAD
jgi:hypothetical protein